MEKTNEEVNSLEEKHTLVILPAIGQQIHCFPMLCWGQGSSYKLVLLINNPVGEALLAVTPLHKTLRTNTTHQIPVSMDLLNLTFQMFSIRQQDTHSPEWQTSRAQSHPVPTSLGQFATTPQRRMADGGFPHANLYSLSPVQFRSEVQKQLVRGLIETSAIIWNMSLLLKGLKP